MAGETQTTRLVSRKSEDGKQSKRIGISAIKSELTEEQVDRGLAWLRRLPQLPLDQLPEKAEVERIAMTMNVPADPAWIMAYIAALLSTYRQYEKNIPQSLREFEAEDWHRALSRYPKWAIQRAGRWWKGPENPNRRWPPIEGDIAARCKVELGPVPYAVDIVERRLTGRDYTRKNYEQRERLSPQEMDEMRAKAEEFLKKASDAKDIRAGYDR